MNFYQHTSGSTNVGRVGGHVTISQNGALADAKGLDRGSHFSIALFIAPSEALELAALLVAAADHEDTDALLVT